MRPPLNRPHRSSLPVPYPPRSIIHTTAFKPFQYTQEAICILRLTTMPLHSFLLHAVTPSMSISAPKLRYLIISVTRPSGPQNRQITHSPIPHNVIALSLYPCTYNRSHVISKDSSGLLHRKTSRRVPRPIVPTPPDPPVHPYKPERDALISISTGNFRYPKTAQKPYLPILGVIIVRSPSFYNAKRTFPVSTYPGALP